MSSKVKFLVFIIAVVVVGYLGSYFRIDPQALQGALKKLPVFYSGLLFIVLYCVVTFFIWFSKDVFRFAAAFLFGAYLSTAFIFIAEVINAFTLFYFARFLGRGFIRETFKAKYNNLDERLGKANFLWLFLFRATPLVPFRFLDLASGLTGIAWPRYLSAVILGSPPRIFWVQYILAGVGLAVLKEPAKLIEYFSLNRTAFIFSFVYFILVAIVAFKIKKRG
ncbi:TVP38/TMEM64 family protein [bacterium]|nr:MAG: TVP38/TMEM64 family protein [bacterium]